MKIGGVLINKCGRIDRIKAFTIADFNTTVDSPGVTCLASLTPASLPGSGRVRHNDFNGKKVIQKEIVNFICVRFVVPASAINIFQVSSDLDASIATTSSST